MLPPPFEAMPAPVVIVVGWMLVSSIVAFIAHGRDKRAAIKGTRRTPEARLHLYELLGGWPGALLGMTFFRHKTRKFSYLLVTALIVITWVGVGTWILFAD